MPITPAGVVRDALTLSPSERAAVAALLLESLDADIDTPESVEAAWEAEIRRRLRATDAGETASISWEDLRSHLQNE